MTRGRRLSRPVTPGAVEDLPAKAVIGRDVCRYGCGVAVIIDTDGDGGLVELEQVRGRWVRHECELGPQRPVSNPVPATPPSSSNGIGYELPASALPKPRPKRASSEAQPGPGHWGEWLKAELKRLGMSQTKLGELVGVTGQRINQVVQNQLPPDRRYTDLADRIEAALRQAKPPSTPPRPRRNRRRSRKPKPQPDKLRPITVDGAGATFARHIRRLRLKRNLTQNVLAQRAGLSKSAVSSWEAGRCAWIGKIEKLAAALGCTVADLFREES